MIYIIWGAPRQGKTYWATKLLLDELKRGNYKTKVYSNYPVVYRKPLSIIQRFLNSYIYIRNKIIKSDLKPFIPEKVISTFKWEKDYIYSGVTDSIIVIDEAYLDFNSRDKQYNKDMHSFFATNGHNNNDIWLIAQHYNRIDLIIREMCNIMYVVSKWINPLTGNPLWFTIEGYLSEDDYKLRHRLPENRYSLKRIGFKAEVAKAYDTHYFRKEVVQTPKLWSDVLDLNDQIKIEDMDKKDEKERVTIK